MRERRAANDNALKASAEPERVEVECFDGWPRLHA